MAWPARMLLSALIFAVVAAVAVADDDAGRELHAGLAAARAQNFVEAATHFQLAYRTDPDSTLALYNLGLAEAEIPGREPRAMCWLAAFIASRPDVQNKAAIVDKIHELQALSRANIARLILLANEVGNRAPDDRETYRTHVTFRTASLWVQAGEKAKAEELLPSLPPDYVHRVQSAIAGQTLFSNDRVKYKARNEDAGYHLDHQEPYSTWDRFFRWTQGALGYAEQEDQDRADAWARACAATALSQPLFMDQSQYLRSLADNYVDRGEWTASIGLARDIADATAEVIYVQNFKSYEIREMLAAVATPWVALGGLALLAGAYVVCFVVVPFVPLPQEAGNDTISTKLKVAGGFFFVWLALGAWAGSSMVTVESKLAEAAWPFALLGAAFLLLIVAGSIIACWVFVAMLKSVFVQRKAS